jgi:voltage-gated potassium channel
VSTPRLEQRLTATLAGLTLRKAVYLIVSVATALALTAAVLERLIDPAFATFGQALWFTITTVSTVGYGDYVPESAGGKLVASALMLAGLSLIPLITSVVVSILVGQRNREARDEQQRDLAELQERLEHIERTLGTLTRDGPD